MINFGTKRAFKAAQMPFRAKLVAPNVHEMHIEAAKRLFSAASSLFGGP